MTRLWSQTGRGWDRAARTTRVPQIGIEPPDAPRERYVTAYHGRASGHRPRANDMEPRIHVITLAVRDLDRALAFYRDGLGLESAGVVGTEFTGDDDTPAGAIALFRLEGELILSLYPRTELAKDADVPFGPPKSGEFSIGHLVATREDVDELLAQAEAAGATRTAPAHDRPWGSTPATSATSMVTSGRSSGIPGSSAHAEQQSKTHPLQLRRERVKSTWSSAGSTKERHMQGHGFAARTSRMQKIKVGLGTAALLATFASLPATASGAAGVVYAQTIGGPGHASMYASGLDVDSSGNVYIADTGNDQVAAYSPTGKQLWRVGVRGTKQLGRFNNPRDVAYLNGKLYVDDTGWNRVQVLNASNGAAISQWPVHFGSTLGISAGVDGSGNHVIFVSEDIQNRVQEFTPAGALIRTFGTGLGSGLGQLNAPRDAATDSAGNVYVADYNNNRIAKFSPTGAPLKGWGTRGTGNNQFIRPYGVAVDAANRVYVADSDNNRIQQFSATGGYLRTYGAPGTGPRQFFQLRRVAVGTGSSPLVYGADLWGNKILRFSQTGVYQATYGGTPGRNGGFNEPSGPGRRLADVRVRQRQPAGAAVRHGHRRLATVVWESRLGQDRPDGVQLAARHHDQQRHEHDLGVGHQEQPAAAVHPRRCLDRRVPGRGRQRGQPAALALWHRVGRAGSDRCRHLQQPRLALVADAGDDHVAVDGLLVPEGRGGGKRRRVCGRHRQQPGGRAEPAHGRPDQDLRRAARPGGDRGGRGRQHLGVGHGLEQDRRAVTVGEPAAGVRQRRLRQRPVQPPVAPGDLERAAVRVRRVQRPHPGVQPPVTGRPVYTLAVAGMAHPGSY